MGSSGQAARKGQQPRDFVLMEGEGWKMGYDRNPINTTAYTALIGSDTWSVSLTRDEFTDFLQVDAAKEKKETYVRKFYMALECSACLRTL